MDLKSYDRGALWGLRAALAGFLDSRSTDPRVAMRIGLSEDPELIEAAHHISAAIKAIRKLEDRL